MNWKQLKNKRKLVTLLRQVATEDLHWNSLMNCGIGHLCRLDGDDMSSNLKEVPAGTLLTDKDGVKTFRSKSPVKVFDTTNIGQQQTSNVAANPFDNNGGKSLWCMSEKHKSIERLNKRYGLTIGHIRAIEMTNDMSVIMRLAKKDVYPPAKLYKNKKYMQVYINELADMIEEYLPKKAVQYSSCDLLTTIAVS